jgi:hypothetical protein
MILIKGIRSLGRQNVLFSTSLAKKIPCTPTELLGLMDDEREGINYNSFFDNSKIWGNRII